METPVALIVFNRPELTLQVISVLRRIEPKHLLIIADGPRSNVESDLKRCQAVRQLIDEKIDWNCRVDKNYSDINLGCKRRPETGIDWVFEQVEQAIILEDDCLPDESFFPYCESLLHKYRNDERVMMISGYCFFDEEEPTGNSYHYSYLASTWGWATWRRAWLLNDPFLSNWPHVIESKLIDQLFPHKTHTKYWYDVFARILDGRLPDAWDYQWQLSCWVNSGYRIFPRVNLVKNIGHGNDATHTFSPSIYSNRINSISIPLKAPQIMVRSYEWDQKILNSFCVFEGYPLNTSFFHRLSAKLISVLRNIKFKLKLLRNLI